MKARTYSKSELARMYKVHTDTLKKWLKLIPDLNLLPNQKILTPKQVEKVLEHLGEP